MDLNWASQMAMYTLISCDLWSMYTLISCSSIIFLVCKPAVSPDLAGGAGLDFEGGELGDRVGEHGGEEVGGCEEVDHPRGGGVDAQRLVDGEDAAAALDLVEVAPVEDEDAGGVVEVDDVVESLPLGARERCQDPHIRRVHGRVRLAGAVEVVQAVLDHRAVRYPHRVRACTCMHPCNHINTSVSCNGGAQFIIRFLSYSAVEILTWEFVCAIVTLPAYLCVSDLD